MDATCTAPGCTEAPTTLSFGKCEPVCDHHFVFGWGDGPMRGILDHTPQVRRLIATPLRALLDGHSRTAGR